MNPLRHPFVRLAVVLAIGIALPSTAPSAAPQANAGRRVTPTNVTAITAAEFFAPAKVWTVSLTMSAEAWAAMQPRRGAIAGGGRLGGNQFLGPPGRRNGIAVSQGIEFDYVRATLQINDWTFRNVAVRYKGNWSYLQARRSGTDKISLKVDLNKYVKGQNFYVYLHPVTNRMYFIAWDQDFSFGSSRTSMGTLSIHSPWSGHPFLSRLNKVDAFRSKYLARMAEFSKRLFVPERFMQQISEIGPALRPSIELEGTNGLAAFIKPAAGGNSRRGAAPRAGSVPLYPQRVARGDLRAAPPRRQLLQRLVERQRRLLRVPAPRELRGHGLPARQLDPEAGEAERPRPVGRRVVFLAAESVPRFPFAASGAQRGSAGRLRGRRAHPGRPSIVQCQLTCGLIHNRLCHVRDSPRLTPL